MGNSFVMSAAGVAAVVSELAIRLLLIRAASAESALIGAPAGANPNLTKAVSPLTYIDALPKETPMPAFAIMHGALDPFIGRGQSGRLFSALPAHQGATTLQYVLLPEGGHRSGDFEKLRRMSGWYPFWLSSSPAYFRPDKICEKLVS